MLEPNFDKILKLQRESLKQIHKDIQMMSLEIARDAARMSREIITSVLKSDAVRETMSRIGRYGGVSGRKAGQLFKQEFVKAANTTGQVMNKVTGAINDIERRTVALSERMTGGWDKAAENARLAEQASAEIDNQIKMNNDLIKKLTYRVKVAKNKKERKPFQDEIDRLNELNDELDETKKKISDLGTQTRMLDIREKFQGYREKVLGRLDPAKIREGTRFYKDFGMELLKNPKMLIGGLAIGLAGVLKVVFGELMAGVRVFRDAGLTASQTIKGMAISTDVSVGALKKGVLLSQEEAAKSVANMQRELGSIEIPTELVTTTATLSRTLKLTNGEAEKLGAIFYRFNGRNAAQAAESVQKIADTAVSMGANAAEILRQMAESSEELARSGNMSEEAFAKAAIHAQRLGINMASISGMADRIVSDFEGALVSAAKIQVIAPGADMSEVMYASQFGSTLDIIKATKGMIDQMPDLATLPRSLKLQLSEATGISAADMLKLQRGEIDESQLADRIDTAENFQTSLLDILSGDRGILGTLKNILSVMTLGTAKFFFGGDKTKQAEERFNRHREGRFHRSEFHTGGVVGMPRHFGDLKSDEILAKLQHGEGVLTERMLHTVATQLAGAEALRNLVVDRPVATRAVAVETPPPPPPPSVEGAKVDLSPVTDILNEILSATKRGHVIHMDGRRVGGTILESYSRGG